VQQVIGEGVPIVVPGEVYALETIVVPPDEGAADVEVARLQKADELEGIAMSATTGAMDVRLSEGPC
jgi:hypothetical protein